MERTLAVPRLGLYFFAVPGGGGFAEVGFVGQVAGQRGGVAEDYVFPVGVAGAHGVEVGPHVRLLFVPGNAAEGEALQAGFSGGFGIGLLVQFVDIFFAHGARETGRIVAGRLVLAGLRVISERVFGDFENALGAAKARDCKRLGPVFQAEVDRDVAVLQERGVNVGHVAAVFPAEDAAGREDAL